MAGRTTRKPFRLTRQIFFWPVIRVLSTTVITPWLVVSKKGRIPNAFKATHRNSQQRVLLEFVAGLENSDLKVWNSIESLVETACHIRHVNLLSVDESVSLPHHRFVVGEYPKGVSLATKLPRKARLPWANATIIVSQVARAVEALHAAGIRHGSISPRTTWIQKSGLVQLRLPIQTDPGFESLEPGVTGNESKFHYLPPEWSRETTKPTKRGDTYALGCLLLRAITGRPPVDGSTAEAIMQQHRDAAIPNLDKYALPATLVDLLRQMLDKDAAKRPADLAEVSRQLAVISGKADWLAQFKADNPSSLIEFRRSLNRFKPGTERKIVSVPEIQTQTDPPDDLDSGPLSPQVAADRAEKIHAASAAALRRKQNRWKLPAAIGGSLVIFAALIAGFAFNANRTVVEVSPPAEKQTEPVVDSNSEDAAKGVDTTLDFGSIPESERPILIQNLIADDQQSLWESPTVGAPLDLRGLPAAPKLVFSFRLREIAANPEGQRMLQSLGPEVQSVVNNWKMRSGLELEAVEQLIVSLHTNDAFAYEPFFVVRLAQPMDQERLFQLWNRPAVAAAENGQKYFAGESDAFYVLPAGESIAGSKPAAQADEPENQKSSPSESGLISRYAYGSPALINEVANNLGLAPVTGPLKNIAEATDRDRHFNLLYLRNALFNDEGQSLMGPRLSRLNRELSLVLPENIRGGSISLHIDNGTYIEFGFERSLDLKPGDLQSTMMEQFRTQRDRLTQFVGTIPPSAYWDKVRLRYDNMLTDAFRNLRWNVEHGEVVANCWLPPMAAHNLIAASELVVSFSTGASTTSAAAAVTTGPQTMDDLLAVKRDLKIANPPDLNLLMSDIQSDVNEDYRSLPFQFRIRLMGSHLEKEGITQNQRPGELDLRQQTLADILTTIMVGANPSKDISGPADPNCKLIWVVADDPEEPGKTAVLITTRTAAKENGYPLPEAFKTE